MNKTDKHKNSSSASVASDSPNQSNETRANFRIKDCGDYFRVKWLDGLGEISCYTKDAYGFATVAELREWIINERLA